MSDQGIPSWAVPGAKVVCVRKAKWPHPHAVSWIVKMFTRSEGPSYGEECTVIKVHGNLLVLQGYETQAGYGAKSGFHWSQFRPLTSTTNEAQRKADIDLFRHHLIPSEADA